MLVLSSCGSHRASCGKWSLSAACTQLVGRQDLQIVSTNKKQDFSGLYTLTVITDEQSKSSRKYPSCSKPDTFFLHSAPVCSLLKLRFGLMRLSLHGLFLWHSNLETIQMSRSFILQFIRSLALCGEKERHRPHIAFHDLLCQMSAQTNRWEP